MQGLDKTLLQREGERVLRRSISILNQCCARVCLVARDASQARELSAELQIETFADQFNDCGPLGGLATAMDACRSDVFLLACDLPFIELPLLQRLVAEFESSQANAVVPRTSQLEPLCAVWSRRCLTPAIERIQQHKLSMTKFAEEVQARVLDLNPVQAAQLRNINLPADLAGGGLKIEP